MFKAVNSDNKFIEVLDTTDGVVECYKNKVLTNLLMLKPEVFIENVVLVQSAKEPPFVFIYQGEDVLFDGKDFKLVLDRGSEIVHLICKSTKDNFSVLGFWVNQRGKIRVVNTLTGASYRFSDKFTPSNLLVYACKTAEEYLGKVSSLFLDFGGCILEFHKRGELLNLVLPDCVEKDI